MHLLEVSVSCLVCKYCKLCSNTLYYNIAGVSGLSVAHLEEICPKVMVSWTPVNLSVVDHYTVHYTTVGGVNGTLTFPASASSGVVSGLQEGQQYQFSVTVTLNVNGELFSGSQRSIELTKINVCNAVTPLTETHVTPSTETHVTASTETRVTALALAIQ